jgi:leucyl aminopeptidase
MEIALAQEPPADAGVVAFAVADARAPRVDELLGRRAAALRETGELRSELGAVCVVDGDAGRIAASGAGERPDAEALTTAAANVVYELPRAGGTLAWLLDGTLGPAAAEQARAVVDGITSAGYEPGRWKTTEPKTRPVERLVLVGGDEGVLAAARRAATVAEWVSRARDLSNRPPNDLTPERLAERAAEIAAGAPTLTAESLGLDRIRELGMGAFAAVAQGSESPARLIVMRHEPPGVRDGVVLGLVGKAVTFDSGGLSLKPPQFMEDMKHDMSGGAAVVEAIGAIAELEVPLRVLAVVGATENMPSGNAFRPGDILTAMNGKTIEITNTDAEGRLVLADALWYAREQGATHLVDLATLTGAVVIALGDLYAGAFGNDDAWVDQVVAAGEAVGDHVWKFPMHPRYRRYADSIYADLKNSSDYRQAGPVYAAKFLEEFVDGTPWVHLDVAGTAFLERSRGDYLRQRGGTGYGVRLLVELATRLAG